MVLRDRGNRPDLPLGAGSGAIALRARPDGSERAEGAASHWGDGVANAGLIFMPPTRAATGTSPEWRQPHMARRLPPRRRPRRRHQDAVQVPRGQRPRAGRLQTECLREKSRGRVSRPLWRTDAEAGTCSALPCVTPECHWTCLKTPSFDTRPRNLALHWRLRSRNVDLFHDDYDLVATGAQCLSVSGPSWTAANPWGRSRESASPGCFNVPFRPPKLRRAQDATTFS